MIAETLDAYADTNMRVFAGREHTIGASEIGQCARVAAGSVVIKPVPNNVTVAGVPAKVIGEAGCAEPSRTMDQMLYNVGA